ncbi:HDOD domain-containing protein [Pelagicoccus sp. SDUM812003]|uniref:HDOD domain-containing protein n=1 Tax=Pelagicoccus sp. SDUM812003 TaxID=3041267 RepID=UPI00280E568D|nr:HDOD domain-containing protein [Pelagicoccus sp. SDUM812003]MDQ8201683.1 HDOD domain-containing protein [Pelagicoccus sp. SDUM812003]
MSTNPHETDSYSPKQIVANAIIEGIRSGKLELPVIPQVASKIFSLTNDPNADMKELSKLIHGDQSIASHVLRIANSASYTSGEPIVSLQQAVTRLGMKLLGEIAIAVSIQSDIFKAPGFEAHIKGLLKHALASAAYGREIARKRRRNVEGQFLCGLLHSVGKPICLQLISTVQKRKEITLADREVAQIVGMLHSKIATKVAIDWKLPKQLQVTTVFFSKYEGAPNFKDESAATYLSQLLASWLISPAKLNAIELAKDPVLEFLNLYPDDFQDLLQKKDDVKSVVAAMEL